MRAIFERLGLSGSDQTLSDASNITIKTPRPCGACTMCCDLFGVPEYQKPGGGCQHVTAKGCAIYSARPAACRSFQCMWTVVAAFDDAWRPDRCGFMITSQDMRLTVDVDPKTPDAWRAAPYYARLKQLSARDRAKFLMVIVRTRGHAIMLFPETDIDLGRDRPEVTITSGYEVKNGRRVPYARYEAPTTQ